MICPFLEKIISVPGLTSTLKSGGIKIGSLISTVPVLKIILLSWNFKKLLFLKLWIFFSYKFER